MRVFELHFNIASKKNIIFDSFYYEPETAYEKRLGSLFMVGELRKTVSRDSRLLNNLARVIKTKFYGHKIYSTEKSLRETLKQANEFLQELIKQGDTSWLSNLNFAVLTLTPITPRSEDKKQELKGFKINLTKTGDIEILLLTQDQVLNLAQGIEPKQKEVYPVKTFFNIVSGRATKNDRILILSQNLYREFLKRKTFNQLGQLPFLDQKILNKTLKHLGKEVSGTALLIDLSPEQKEKPNQRLIFKGSFLNKKIFKLFKKFFNVLKKKLAKIPVPSFLEPIAQFLTKIFRHLAVFLNTLRSCLQDKRIIWVVILLITLVLGEIVVGIEQERRSERIKAAIASAEENISQAKSFLMVGQQEKANDLFFEAWNTVEPFSRLSPLNLPELAKLEEVKRQAEEKLLEINNMERIENPELFFEFKKEDLLPQRIIFYQGKIYAFAPYSDTIFAIEKGRVVGQWSEKMKPQKALVVNSKLLFFSKPNAFGFLEGDRWSSTFSLGVLSQNFEFTDLSSSDHRLYVWDKKLSQIIQYRYSSNQESNSVSWQGPNPWLEKRITDVDAVKSMTSDQGVWLLKLKNQLNYYINGKLNKAVEVNTFPLVKNITKVWTSSSVPYLYLLEPKQKRVIIMDKTTNQVIKQYQSESFDNLKDLVVSDDAKEIYLLNGFKIYLIRP